jgi:hypothetical protein
MSEYQALCLKEILGSELIPEIRDWNKNTQEMLAVTRMYREIARRKSINVIYIAWETPEKDDVEGVYRRDVGFTPSLARQFPGIVDIIGFMTVNTNNSRQISFQASPKTAAKFRRSKIENAVKIPNVIKFGEDDYPLVDLLAVLRGNENWPDKKYERRQASNTNGDQATQ